MDYVDKMIKNNDIVRSDRYKCWLVEFMQDKEKLCDDDYLYNNHFSEEDKEYISLLGYFQNHIEELADKQNVFPKEDDFDIYPFKLGGEYFEIVTVCGQGTFTAVSKVEFYENDDYIYVDEQVPSEVIKAHELVEYIIINKDLIDVISSAKFGVHIGHACTLATVAQCNTKKFKKWYKDGTLQKKIILKAPLQKLEELEKDFFAVRDLGYTEVENNTLIAVSLGIMSRKEATKYIKRLQTW